ncbi:MAG: hypothetical protein DRJ50_04060 [Actinobacteria bacterium]|nr:MAG: hypothetical protein DRJ50_04060 [Actinomycetota bacterium]
MIEFGGVTEFTDQGTHGFEVGDRVQWRRFGSLEKGGVSTGVIARFISNGGEPLAEIMRDVPIEKCGRCRFGFDPIARHRHSIPAQVRLRFVEKEVEI